MTIQQRSAAFITLGKQLNLSNLPNHNELNPFADQLLTLQQTLKNSNGWFTPESVSTALKGISEMLSEDSITSWLKNYHFPTQEPLKNIGVIMAGNIPGVGFHDAMCILLSGNRLLAKLSSQDDVLIPHLLKMLCDIEPEFNNRIEIISEQLRNIDAIIATGSSNSSRYFDYYFAKYPNIIRKNRNSIAVLTGAETPEELDNLCLDVFTYFGLGCRNVSKLMVPKDYNYSPFFERAEAFSSIKNESKYFNNYEYSKSIFLINGVPHLDNGFLIIKEDPSLHSPIGVLHSETYQNLEEVKMKLLSAADQLQCVIASSLSEMGGLPFGKSQFPGAGDYADGVDTMAFLLELGKN